MTQVCFDPHALGVPASDDHCADVRGPGAGNGIPTMMRSKFIGQTAAKVVCLSDIYRVPKPISALTTENINAADRVKSHSDSMVLKLVPSSASARPDKRRERLD